MLDTILAFCLFLLNLGLFQVWIYEVILQESIKQLYKSLKKKIVKRVKYFKWKSSYIYN